MLPINNSTLDDTIYLLPEEDDIPKKVLLKPWKILIVDDEPDVHASTRIALKGTEFRGRDVEFISAYSGEEALDVLRKTEDIAAIFLDVVMETDDAGLRAAKKLREEGFTLPRIILRTGHPGYAPENSVIIDYDIHDYKLKSTLNRSRLFTCLISALRAYADLLSIEQHRRGLLSVLDAVSWFDFRSLQRYLGRMLAELPALANAELDSLLLAHNQDENEFKTLVDGLGPIPLNAEEAALIHSTFASKQSQTSAIGSTFFSSTFGVNLLIFSRDPNVFQHVDFVLLDIFLTKLAQALSNHQTFAEILSERDSLVLSLADQNECWGGHTHSELNQMQKLAQAIAARLQARLDFPDEIDDWFVFSIATACCFHDLGIEKPTNELALITQNIQHGLTLLKQRLNNLNSNRLYNMAADVITQHHERYDGSGYPCALSGNNISVAARIVAVVDTFVTLTSSRPQRVADSKEIASTYIRLSSGTLFDPRVVVAFLEVLEPGAALA